MGPFILKIIFFFVVCLSAIGYGQGPQRNRGEGLYQLTTSNTTGSGNVFLGMRGSAFMWAGTPDSAAMPRLLGDIQSEVGVNSFASLLAGSRVVSYTKNKWPQFGNVWLGTRLTIPDNKELRLQGYGLELKYIYNTIPFFASLGGYRVAGTGFNAEGYTVQGSTLQCKLIYDTDLISILSWLPIKAGINLGFKIPLLSATYVLPQYLCVAGVSYVGLGFDIFAEYSLEAFNNVAGPIKIPGLGISDRVMEVAFSENPMFLTLGGRVRYDNGVTLNLYVPLLLSTNVGSAMTTGDNIRWNTTKDFDNEKARGINSPFDPWFAKWKIVGELSFPLFYKQTGSEMMRNFLLMKALGKIRKMDIDEQLRKIDEPDSMATQNEERKKRLDNIKRRRENIEKSE